MARKRRSRELADRVGARVRARRIALGESQEALATRVGVATSTIVRVELGLAACSLSLLVEIAEKLGVRPGELIDDVPFGSGSLPLDGLAAPERAAVLLLVGALVRASSDRRA